MRAWLVVGVFGSILGFTATAGAAIITGGVYTNFCYGAPGALEGSNTLGPYSGTCTSGNSTFSVSGDAEGSGLIWGDQISATDSSVDPNASGSYGYAYTQYEDTVTLSTEADITLNFDVQGTTSNINGYYADYYIEAGLYQDSGDLSIVRILLANPSR